MLRYVRVWGTCPARDARTVNPNFVRFKTWDWDCGRTRTGEGLAGSGWTGGDCPRFASRSSFPPISSLPPALPLSVPVPPHNSSALAHETQHVSYPSRTQRQNACNCYIARVVCGGLVAELRPPSSGTVTLHTITNSKFG